MYIASCTILRVAALVQPLPPNFMVSHCILGHITIIMEVSINIAVVNAHLPMQLHPDPLLHYGIIVMDTPVQSCHVYVAVCIITKVECL
jgi:cell division protein FtsW (lipid II flippase)